ncbi:MAG: helix-hairpin-helix domain-containing protein [Bacteroidetes bacterium]|nr:helix-hairpin-helix domain-containing protein [Bacteroidota bacterium]
MVHKLNNAQKRGLLIGLAALVLLAGWRLRARHLENSAPLIETASEGPEKPKSARIELNTADTTLLQTVKGIGPASARRIVKYRSLIGGFTHTDQLLKVWGITPENFIRIEEQVFVDTTTTTFAALKKGKFNPYAQQSYPSVLVAATRMAFLPANLKRQPRSVRANPGIRQQRSKPHNPQRAFQQKIPFHGNCSISTLQILRPWWKSAALAPERHATSSNTGR